MTTTKDWTIGLARAIHFIFDLKMVAPQDTSIPRLSLVIKEHCPFRPDVMYIPVPRCDSCKHWLQTTGDSTGECLRPYEQLTTKLWASMYDRIHTQPDFGCVQWETK